jgi:hypothetical protein
MALDQTSSGGAGGLLQGTTICLWMMQSLFQLAGDMTLANWASIATIFSATCASAYWLYSLYRKSKEK